MLFVLWFYQYPELTYNSGFLTYTAEVCSINGCYWFLPKSPSRVWACHVYSWRSNHQRRSNVCLYVWSQLFTKISSELCFAFFLSLLVDDSCSDGSITQTEKRKSAGFFNLKCLHHMWNDTTSPPQRLVQTHRGMFVTGCCLPFCNFCSWFWSFVINILKYRFFKVIILYQHITFTLFV